MIRISMIAMISQPLAEALKNLGTNYLLVHKCISSPQVQVRVPTEVMDYSWWWKQICAQVCLFIQSNCTASTHHPGTWDSFQDLHEYASSEWTRGKNVSAVFRIHQKTADPLVLILLFPLNGLLPACCQHSSGHCLRDLIENKMHPD